MSYSRYMDNVTLTMTSDQYAQLLFILGYACGARYKEGDRGVAYKWIEFVNENLSAGNSQ